MADIKSNIFNQLIEETVGLSVDSIKSKSSDELLRHIEYRKKTHVELDNGEYGFLYRGNMLLAMGRVNNDVNSKYDATFK